MVELGEDPGRKVEKCPLGADLCCHLYPGYLVPDLESFRTPCTVLPCLQPMATRTEMLADWPEGSEEALGMAS